MNKKKFKDIDICYSARLQLVSLKNSTKQILYKIYHVIKIYYLQSNINLSKDVEKEDLITNNLLFYQMVAKFQLDNAQITQNLIRKTKMETQSNTIYNTTNILSMMKPKLNLDIWFNWTPKILLINIEFSCIHII